MEPLALKPCMSYSDLLNKIYTVTGSDPMYTELNIKMRFESASGVQVLPVLNDEHLEILRGVVALRSVPAELYVEMVPICTQQTTYLPSLQMPSYNIPSVDYGMGSFTRMLQDDQIDIPFSSHFTAPAPSTSNNDISSPMQLHSYSPMHQHVEATPSQTLVYADSVVNNEMSVLDMYEDTVDGSEGEGDEDVSNNELSDNDAVARTPLPWFSQINENYEVDMYWADGGNQSSFVVGGEFEKGMIFDCKKSLLDMVKKYSIQRNQFYTTVTSNENVLHLRCQRKCGWALRGTKTNLNGTAFKIVSYKGPHRDNCVNDVPLSDHRHLDSSIISDYVKPYIEKDPCLRIEFIQQLIAQQFQFDVPYRRAWYAKQKAIADIFGDWESSYNKLPLFMQALKESNPGTVVVWKFKPIAEGFYYSNMEVFERVFWAFKPCIDGFTHCMPVISIDGTHLYGKYKGTLLVATSVDANFQVFPLAFTLVEGENTSSWSWFLSCIREHVTERDGLCIISDRHAGIIAAMSNANVGFNEPRAFHRYCV